MKNERPKISVVINTYNAERFLEKVIRSVLDFDEILVCDMESTDSTIDIAEKHKCRIVTFPKRNHTIVEPARDFAIHSAANEWVLVVDADEIVTAELKEYLYHRAAEPHCPAGFYIPRRNRFIGRKTHSSPDYQLRFFKKSLTVWPNQIHSVPQINGEVEKIKSSWKSNVCLDHLADSTVYEVIEKLNRYTCCELDKKGRNFSACAIIYRPLWTFLRTYFMQGGFRDGTRGVIRCMLRAFYQVALVAKILEHKMEADA